MSVALVKTPAELAYDGLILPHPRLEDWKWTNLRTLVDRPYPPRLAVAAADADVTRLMRSSPFAALARARLVFVNGHFDEVRSTLPASGDVTASKNDRPPIASDEPVIAMNAAFATDGIRLEIKAGANIDTPIEIVSIATKGADRTIATRHVIDLGAGASATIIETHLGEGGYLANSVVEFRLGENVRLDRIKAELESPEALHLAHVAVTIGTKATLHDFTLTAGARVNRQNGSYDFAGKHADARISGAYLLAGRQHADSRLVVNHAVPCCTSRELFRCVLDGHARGIFQGKVIVARDAQKTDGKQSSHALLLSETAEFDAKPELEIYADDVVCGHGATAGDIDHDHLFYLRSRGIPEPEAKALLIAAFAGEAFETIGHEGLRDALSNFADGWLERRGS
ncbi:Fe-S cluster assembly protein SufD [soil metagenome]